MKKDNTVYFTMKKVGPGHWAGKRETTEEKKIRELREKK